MWCSLVYYRLVVSKEIRNEETTSVFFQRKKEEKESTASCLNAMYECLNMKWNACLRIVSQMINLNGIKLTGRKQNSSHKNRAQKRESREFLKIESSTLFRQREWLSSQSKQQQQHIVRCELKHLPCSCPYNCSNNSFA